MNEVLKSGNYNKSVMIDNTTEFSYISFVMKVLLLVWARSSRAQFFVRGL